MPTYRELVLPISTETVVALAGTWPLSEAEWDQFIHVLAAMKPGLVVPAEQLYDVVVTSVPGDKKIQAIKGIRGASQLGLKEAKDFYETFTVPGHSKTLLSSVSLKVAHEACDILESEGVIAVIDGA